jgi:hypothetical protein
MSIAGLFLIIWKGISARLAKWLEGVFAPTEKTPSTHTTTISTGDNSPVFIGCNVTVVQALPGVEPVQTPQISANKPLPPTTQQLLKS